MARRLSSVQEGCLPLILDMVLSNKITVHTEIPFHELTFTDKIGEGGAGSVWRGQWNAKHVAIKVRHHRLVLSRRPPSISSSLVT